MPRTPGGHASPRPPGPPYGPPGAAGGGAGGREVRPRHDTESAGAGDATERADVTERSDVTETSDVAGERYEEADAASETVEEDLQMLLGAARHERDEYLDMLRRVQADFENYKKRMLRQQTDHLERAAEGLVTKLLPVLDAFDLAREHLGQGDDTSPEGKALLQASALLFDTLAKEGLERIDDPGAVFDPMTHDAVERVDATPTSGEGVASAPVVDGVHRAGYRWKGRVIRPAMVRVRG